MQSRFEDFKCWKACYQLKIRLRNEVILTLPKEEKYELASQLLRASRSSNTNIAEGDGRYHYKDSVRFLLNARGSCYEIIDHLIEAVDCAYISREIYQNLRLEIERAISC